MNVLDDAEALALLLSLEDRQVDLTLDGSELVVSPKSMLTQGDIIAIRRNKPSLVTLVQIADLGVQDRLESFKAQRPSTAPVFTRGWRYLKGVCFSCGVRTRADQWGRCWRCALALRLALGSSISTGAGL